jgi:uncharacterized Zn-binding protein involved in type VI secretion
MAAVTLLNDICSGHDCFPSRTNDTASTNVFVEGRGVHRQSDHWTTHCCPDNGCHDSILATGSSSVYINGLQCGRIGDPIACGSTVITGASSVYAGG